MPSLLLMILTVLLVHCGSDSPDLFPFDDAATDAGNDALGGAFTVGGTVTGLAGSGLVLQNNGADNVAVNADGAFTFTKPIANGAAYGVSVLTDPMSPAQTCTIANGNGTVASSNVTNVTVTCTTKKFSIGGTISGVTGSGLVLVNNGTDPITPANGMFTFPATLASGSAFNITVMTQPTNPTQTCSVTGGTGVVGTGDVTGVVVNCSTNTFTVGGIISGLSGTVVLQNNAGNNLTLNANGSFAFSTPVPSGAAYAVTVLTQPSSPSQTCTVTVGSGMVANANVTSVRVACTTNTFTVGGTVTGLVGSGLVLQNNAGDNLPRSASGAFTFATSVPSGAPYAVTVLTQPTAPAQVCTVTNGGGVVGGANVTTVSVTCATSAFTVGGTVSGLAGTGLVLRNNGGDDLAVPINGSFTFATPLASGATYAVTVRTQPSNPTQVCTVTNAGGVVGGGNVTTVSVTCATSVFTIGGTVSGLAGTGLVLRNNGGDDLPVSASGSFTFATPLASGATYAVTVATQPSTPTQVCTVSAGGGTVTNANVTSVVVTCTTTVFTVGGTVSGLLGTGLVLRNNGGDDLPIAADGSFTFATPVASGGAYLVTVATPPSGPTQTCSVSFGSGVVTNANITNVSITCATSTFTIGGTVSGLTGAGLVLLDNGGDNLPVPVNGSFTFTTPVASGAGYAVTIGTQPAGQLCSVANGGGVVTNANITNVVVSCFAAPTGGTITTSGAFRIHTFTSSGTFQTFGPMTVDYLIVAGGGGGGSGDGAGGGAGGLLAASAAIALNSYGVVVGAGGAGAGVGDVGSLSANGFNSSFAGFAAIGGGRGGQEDNVGGGGPANFGGSGGSGGGFGGANNASPFPAGGLGTAGQGTNAGTRGVAPFSFGMGGGGGAGGAGGNGGPSNQGGAGGLGISSSISGVARFYAGGGGGSSRGSTGGAGGSGVGGSGGSGSFVSGSAALPNTGGGGGGGGDQTTTGGAGGSGIVIIRYLM